MIHLGTSGWQYRDWRGRFYPGKLPQRLWLEHCASPPSRCSGSSTGPPPSATSSARCCSSGWAYLRLHEGRAKPGLRYGRQALDTWAGRLDPAVDTYVYVNNDPGGAAVTDASAFAALARRRGLDVTRAPG